MPLRQPESVLEVGYTQVFEGVEVVGTSIPMFGGAPLHLRLARDPDRQLPGDLVRAQDEPGRWLIR